MLGAWPGKCDEDCEVGSCLPMDPGNDGDGEGTLRPPSETMHGLKVWYKDGCQNYFQNINMMK